MFGESMPRIQRFFSRFGLPLAAAMAVVLLVVALIATFKRPRREVISYREGLTWRNNPIEIRQFVTAEECEIIKALASKNLSRSTVVGAQDPHPSRTSEGTFLNPNVHPVVSNMYDRVSAMLGVPRSHMENLQVLRYKPGQQYYAHHDSCFDGCDNGNNIERYATIIVYLNDDFEGGETEFPEHPISVTPETGKAAVFFNLNRAGTAVLQESLHRAAPPTRGTKWSAAIWVRNKPWQ